MKKILVLGAGFGGLCAATRIAKKLKRLGLDKKYEVILVDKNDHHTYTPLLYEVATTSKNTADMCRLHEVAAYNIPSLIGGLPIRSVQDEVVGFDATGAKIALKKGGELDCEFMVLALGAETNYFGIKGLRENSMPLKEFIDAIKIRDHIWNMAMEGREIKVLIGGGGSTGVEFAGELKAWCGELEKENPKCRLSVEIVEAGPTLLAGFPEKIVRSVTYRLEKFGVKITAGKKIVEVKENIAILDDRQKISFDIFVWAGGVKAPAIITKMPFKLEPKGRALVEEKLPVCITEDFRMDFNAKIYGIGDSVCFYNPITKRPVPAVARAALAQADIAAHNLIEDILNVENPAYKPCHKSYKPRDYPYIIPAGGKWAIAKIGPFIISGFFGWILKGLVELNYLLSIMSFPRAIKTWLKGLLIFIKNDRLG